MATTYKVIAQSAPSAAVMTSVYTCPAATNTVLANICVTNITPSLDHYRIAIRPNGATLENKHYLVFDASLDLYSYEFLTMPVTLSAGDVVDVYCLNGNLVFNIFGSEIS